VVEEVALATVSKPPQRRLGLGYVGNPIPECLILTGAVNPG
jgi:hypothetical protein